MRRALLQPCVQRRRPVGAAGAGQRAGGGGGVSGNYCMSARPPYTNQTLIKGTRAGVFRKTNKNTRWRRRQTVGFSKMLFKLNLTAIRVRACRRRVVGIIFIIEAAAGVSQRPGPIQTIFGPPLSLNRLNKDLYRMI